VKKKLKERKKVFQKVFGGRYWSWGTLGIIFLTLPHRILPFFTEDPEVIRLGSVGLRILGLVQFADAIGMTLWFALSGAGNTTYPAVVESLMVWGFFLPAVYFFGVHLGFGFIGAWGSLAAYIVLFALAMIRKIKTGDWKTIEV